MAFPPPFPNPLLPRIPQQTSVPFVGQKFGFFSPQRQGISVIPGIPMLRPRFRPPVNFVPREPRPPNPNVKPTGPPTTTTVFVGNISDKCPDMILQEILKKCGSVCNWKRLQDSSGKFKAFGFCDFMYPDGARKALNVLKDFPLGDKRLNVKADEQTEKMLEEFDKNKTVSVPEESDESVKAAIQKILEEEAPDLLDIPLDEVQNTADEQSREKSPAAESTKSSSRARKRSRSSSTSTGRRGKSPSKRTGKSPSRKKTRRHSSSSSNNSSSASSESSRESVRTKHKKVSSRKKSPDSDDSVEIEERRRLKREIKEREESYLARLKKWEEREKRMAKLYEKEKEEERQRQKTIQKEAKKLRQFLEDYVDERDDPKYYKGSAAFQRKRNYEREREADAKDRQEEKRELEEIKKSILKERKSLNEEETELAQQDEMEEQNGDSSDAARAPSAPRTEDGEKVAWADVNAAGNVTSVTEVGYSNVESPSLMKKTPIMTTLQQQKMVVAMSKLNGVFQEEDEEVDTLHQIKKKIKPFEITQEDRIQSMTPEERKKLIKDLIARIPMDRAKLFSFNLCWDYVDDVLMEQRVRPWVNKKICDYIGEEEPSLVAFICDKISNKSSPSEVLQDLSMVLDDEAEVFMVKLWRLIVYESEAKRLGLSGISATGPGSAQTDR